MKNIESYLKGLREDDRNIARRILDLRFGALNNFIIKDSDFLYPSEINIAKSVLNYFSDTSYLITGISKNAERKAILVSPFEIDEIESPYDYFTVLRGEIKSGSINHRDILGSLMAIGINRNKIGDIYMDEKYVYIIIKQEIKKYIVQNFTSIKNITISFESVDLKVIEECSLKFEKARIITSSMRVDNVVSNIGSMSRSKALDFIKVGNVKLNWRKETNKNRLLDKDDILSLRGKGKYRIAGIVGYSKKGNIVLEIYKYV